MIVRYGLWTDLVAGRRGGPVEGQSNWLTSQSNCHLLLYMDIHVFDLWRIRSENVWVPAQLILISL